MEITREDVLKALAHIEDPVAGRDIVSLGYVSGLVVRDGHVGFALDLGDDPDAAAKEPLRERAESVVRSLPGVLSATVVLTAERPPAAAPEAAPGPQAAAQGPLPLAGIREVRAIIAVASGKGGVGKSTVAANLAVALAESGLATGLLDADIYGPSVPRLMGLEQEKPEVEGKRLLPLAAHGVATMSIGYLVPEAKAMIWRGPMVASAVSQLLGDVAWGALDILVVDMPPGTGDAQLTLAQRVPLAGALVVSTPQDLALVDARKAIAMFAQVEVPILGIVENMSRFICPHCGTASDIFGHGGARETAAALDVPFLGEIPLEMRIRETSDGGTPVVAAAPASAEAGAFRDLAAAVRARLVASGALAERSKADGPQSG